MPRTIYNKLVRDRIPEYIRSKGSVAVAHVLPPGERLAALVKKVGEEAEELQQAPAEKVPEELADLLEILQAIAAHSGIPWDDVLQRQEAKRGERGGFTEGVFLEYTE
ncbi:MAG: hypothetical protein G01um101438_958 [Parcubacteria group bacterium Gr01-1014_38]|nr:MAG: hypothetical protein G01um101438_958 [Parcubacteria group bacterium Gr01-1014_38]